MYKWLSRKIISYPAHNFPFSNGFKIELYIFNIIYFELLKTKLNKSIQDGIYFDKVPFQAKHSLQNNIHFNHCLALLFLKASTKSANEVRKRIEGLWKMYDDLRMGYSFELEDCAFPPGNLTILISYGQRIFELTGITKKIPLDFKDKQFLPAKPRKPVLPGCGIKYSDLVHDNVGLSEDIALQLISDTQLGTYRAVVETKRYLQKYKMKALKFSKFYTGFQRDDGRSWLGFHDEVSNMKNPKERLDAIAIDPVNNNLLRRDYWTINGTYLAYLRVEIDIDLWNSIERKHQELIIGRDKLTGSPLVGVDKNGNPVTVDACPSAYEVEGFDKRFHEHPDYIREFELPKKVRSILDMQTSAEVLNESHIGRTRHIDNINTKHRVSRRIFRQGYEFLEPVYDNSSKSLRIGQNFISYQNDPSRLFFILTHPDWMGNTNFGGRAKNNKMNKLLSVLAAGVFFVPPLEKPFPGSSLFT
jgi:Dyp-type peroxidase family